MVGPAALRGLLAVCYLIATGFDKGKSICSASLMISWPADDLPAFLNGEFNYGQSEHFWMLSGPYAPGWI
jgi:hypothetical protein